VTAPGCDPTCKAEMTLSLFPSRQFRMLLAHRRDRHDAGKRMGEWLDPLRAEPV
jgi:hypothetical protein